MVLEHPNTALQTPHRKELLQHSTTARRCLCCRYVWCQAVPPDWAQCHSGIRKIETQSLQDPRTSVTTIPPLPLGSSQPLCIGCEDCTRLLNDFGTAILTRKGDYVQSKIETLQWNCFASTSDEEIVSFFAQCSVHHCFLTGEWIAGRPASQSCIDARTNPLPDTDHIVSMRLAGVCYASLPALCLFDDTSPDPAQVALHVHSS